MHFFLGGKLANAFVAAHTQHRAFRGEIALGLRQEALIILNALPQLLPSLSFLVNHIVKTAEALIEKARLRQVFVAVALALVIFRIGKGVGTCSYIRYLGRKPTNQK